MEGTEPELPVIIDYRRLRRGAGPRIRLETYSTVPRPNLYDAILAAAEVGALALSEMPVLSRRHRSDMELIESVLALLPRGG